MPVTLGIDLASQNKKTAACTIRWEDSGAVVDPPLLGTHEQGLDWLVEQARLADATGIDSPFGWPDAAVEAIAAWHHGEPWPQIESRQLRLRLTDQFVYDETKLTPLSVSSDRIAVVAWRCAELLTRLRPGEKPLDRTGRDGVFEVYPGAAIVRWGFERRGYKSRGPASAQASLAARETLLVQIERQTRPWLDLNNARAACLASDDALDSFIAALAARAAEAGQTMGVPPHLDAASVEREGWIHLPREGSLARLLTGR